MDSQAKNSERIERLRQQAVRKTKMSRRLLKKIDKELSKPKSNLSKVLKWQKKSFRQLARGVRLMQKREDIINLRETSERKRTIHFNLEKKSEKFVKKFDATACVYQATMEKPENTETVKLKDILDELDSLFSQAIEQVIYESHSLKLLRRQR